jgi:hypothetical protein
LTNVWHHHAQPQVEKWHSIFDQWWNQQGQLFHPKTWSSRQKVLQVLAQQWRAKYIFGLGASVGLVIGAPVVGTVLTTPPILLSMTLFYGIAEWKHHCHHHDYYDSHRRAKKQVGGGHTEEVEVEVEVEVEEELLRNKMDRAFASFSSSSVPFPSSFSSSRTMVPTVGERRTTSRSYALHEEEKEEEALQLQRQRQGRHPLLRSSSLDTTPILRGGQEGNSNINVDASLGDVAAQPLEPTITKTLVTLLDVTLEHYRQWIHTGMALLKQVYTTNPETTDRSNNSEASNNKSNDTTTSHDYYSNGNSNNNSTDWQATSFTDTLRMGWTKTTSNDATQETQRINHIVTKLLTHGIVVGSLAGLLVGA